MLPLDFTVNPALSMDLPVYFQIPIFIIMWLIFGVIFTFLPFLAFADADNSGENVASWFWLIVSILLFLGAGVFSGLLIWTDFIS